MGRIMLAQAYADTTSVTADVPTITMSKRTPWGISPNMPNSFPSHSDKPDLSIEKKMVH